MKERKINAAVAVNQIFESIINTVSYQEGEELTPVTVVRDLKRYQSEIPAHVYSLLYTMVIEAYDFLDTDDETEKEGFERIKNPYVYEELGEYRKSAEEKVIAEYGVLFPQNMVFGEIYGIIYQKYLKDILSIW